ncbi:MAG: hypothetical protein C6H99_00915 [Epsilonproteobacteria bacterium]|nr:hypothetical protein [Campylobacterota bacterium]
MVYILSSTPLTNARQLPMILQRFILEPIDFLVYDYLLFTSKNAVTAAQKISPSWRSVPSIVIGEATARKVEDLGGRVAYVASRFYGDDLAQEIVERFDPARRYLFLRPKVVATDLGGILRAKGFLVDERIVYETFCAPCHDRRPPPKGSIIIFSSPSTVRCFFRCFTWDESYRAYALGTKTAEALPEGIAYTLCQGRSLQECVDLILGQ